MKSLDERSREFDRDFTYRRRYFARMQKWNTVFFIVSSAVGFGLIGFIVWATVMVMHFFGVV